MRVWSLRVVVFLLVASGCFKICEMPVTGSMVGNALSRNSMMVFMDSSGSQMQLILTEMRLDSVLDSYNRTNSCEGYRTFHVYYFDGIGDEDQYISHNVNRGSLHLSHIQIWPTGGSWGDSVVTIQGQEYSDLFHWTSEIDMQDGRPEFEVLFSKSKALVMMRYKDEYRWERVIN